MIFSITQHLNITYECCNLIGCRIEMIYCLLFLIKPQRPLQRKKSSTRITIIIIVESWLDQQLLPMIKSFGALSYHLDMIYKAAISAQHFLGQLLVQILS